MASTVLGNVDSVFAADSAPNEVSVVTVSTAPSEGDALQRFIDREIVTRLNKTVGWRQLELCFKWKRVSEYMASKGVRGDDAIVASVRASLQGNKLEAVEYDASSHRVIKLGIPEIDERGVLINLSS